MKPARLSSPIQDRPISALIRNHNGRGVVGQLGISSSPDAEQHVSELTDGSFDRQLVDDD